MILKTNLANSTWGFLQMYSRYFIWSWSGAKVGTRDTHSLFLCPPFLTHTPKQFESSHNMQINMGTTILSFKTAEKVWKSKACNEWKTSEYNWNALKGKLLQNKPSGSGGYLHILSKLHRFSAVAADEIQQACAFCFWNEWKERETHPMQIHFHSFQNKCSMEQMKQLATIVGSVLEHPFSAISFLFGNMEILFESLMHLRSYNHQSNAKCWSTKAQRDSVTTLL